MEDIDIYGDGLATELNVSQAHTPVKLDPGAIKMERYVAPPLPLPGMMQNEPMPIPFPSNPPKTLSAGVTYVTQDTFAQQNRHHYIDPNDPKSRTVYVGNLTWWTTDVDLQHACSSLNVNDIVSIKFFENRSNGQSKGYCSVDLSSINSAKTLLHELRNVTIHNEHPYVAIASKTPIYYFESALGIKNDDKTKKSSFDQTPSPMMPPVLPPQLPILPPALQGMPGMPPPPLPMPGMPPPPGCPLPPPMPLPPPPMGLTPMLPPPPDLHPPPAFFPVSVAPVGVPPPMPLNSGAHINPAFLPQAVVPKRIDDDLNEREKNDMIQKNHQVCKTAILRAYESCDSRDYDQAEGTVAAALKIIRLSAVSDEPKSKAFISDLEECLSYVQKRQKKTGKSRSGSNRRTERKEGRRRTRSRSHEDPPRERKRDKRNHEHRSTKEYDSRASDDYKELRRRDLI